MADPERVGAIVLAAGMSRRMGRPKMVLPWGETTVIGKVISTLRQAEVDQIIVVTGGARRLVEDALMGLPIRLVYNPNYANGEMLTSLQEGLKALPAEIQVALVVLGDQPQIEAQVVGAVIKAYERDRNSLVIPSFQMKRGHPWLVDRVLWDEIIGMDAQKTMRDFLNRDPERIRYVDVETPSIFLDLDTPEEYQEQKPS